MKNCLSILLILCLSLSGCYESSATETAVTLDNLPTFSGEPYVELNDNQPDFPDSDKTSTSFERYSQLDYFGRCGAAYANVGLDTMPTEDRGSIGQVKPTGWHTVQYDCVEGKYLYNRCHLIGYQLTAENANELNLITGTRYLNVTGMLPFENEVAEYVTETSNHVLYRVTPIYTDSNLVADGVQMEAWSVEDDGEGVCFNIYAYNVQPGVTIDYATGESRLADEVPGESSAPNEKEPNTNSSNAENSYILNTSSKKFHTTDCSIAQKMSEKNRQAYTGSREDLISEGYEPCGQCKP